MERAVCSFMLCQEIDNHHLWKLHEVVEPHLGYNRLSEYAGLFSVLQSKGIRCSGLIFQKESTSDP